MIDVDDGVSAVLRNERTRNHDILAAGPGEPGHLPALMVDREIAARNKKRAEFGAVAVIRDDTAEQRPSAVIDTAGEMPATGQLESTMAPAEPIR